MASQECRAVYEKESVVRGHHVYKAIWTPAIGEELEVRTEDDNDHDQHAKSTALSLNVTSYALRALLKTGAVPVAIISRYVYAYTC